MITMSGKEVSIFTFVGTFARFLLYFAGTTHQANYYFNSNLFIFN